MDRKAGTVKECFSHLIALLFGAICFLFRLDNDDKSFLITVYKMVFVGDQSIFKFILEKNVRLGIVLPELILI